MSLFPQINIVYSWHLIIYDESRQSLGNTIISKQYQISNSGFEETSIYGLQGTETF